MIIYTKFYLNPLNSCRYGISVRNGVPTRLYIIIIVLMTFQDLQSKPGNMKAGIKLLSGLKNARSSSVSVTVQRLRSTVVQHAAADHLDTGSEYVASTKPYSAVPGPRQLPFIGNAWRFLPYIGKCGVS